MEVIDQVPGPVRIRGEQYYRSGRVKLKLGNETAVHAKVRGSQRYDVRLARLQQTVLMSCSCPYFEDHFDACKHIWATLQAASAKGHLGGDDGSTKRVTLKPFDPEEDVEFDEYEEYDAPPLRTQAPTTGRKRSKKPKPLPVPAWKQALSVVHRSQADASREYTPVWTPGRELLYIIDAPQTLTGRGLIFELAFRERKKDGTWSKPRAERLDSRVLDQLPDAADRSIMALLKGGSGGYYNGYYDSLANSYALGHAFSESLLPLASKTGRLFLRRSEENADLLPLQWDSGPPWDFRIEVTKTDDEHYELQGRLRRGDEQRSLAEPVLLVHGGLAFWKDKVARLGDHGAFEWISLLRQTTIRVPASDREKLQAELLQAQRLPPLDLPPEFEFHEVELAPRPSLKVKKSDKLYGPPLLRGELSFEYDGVFIDAHSPRRHCYDETKRRFIRRHAATEAEAMSLLRQVGFQIRRDYYDREPRLELAPKNLPRAVSVLLAAGWHVQADGKLYRRPGDFRIEVTSGIDWFELHGKIEFGDTTASLPQLLEAVRKGDNLVHLDDGTFGMLPEDWLKKYGVLAGLGKTQDDHLRFTRAQVGVLDALLAAQPEASCDAMFQKARHELRGFEGIRPADPPAQFKGKLRPYQSDGLGWLQFLQRFGFGGCLADDMGLGKTVQVLALLAWRKHASKQSAGPSLVVVPRSLVFNWKQEAARFTPSLRVLDHTGGERLAPGDHFQDYDLILTTYGTLRKEVVEFKDFTFDYCILDESQAIKNATTQSAKAVRLLNARHRLAMSGTPVENHLGELWSLFEFLNPGMLGQASVFRLTGTAGRSPDPETQQLLARALRPFILRRTKEKVARDLPEKNEQTLFCEMEPAQRRQYDELREYYRRSLLQRIEREGMNKAKIQILEALLRLRQAACHPALIDKNSAAPSAKLDALLPQLEEVFEEGHKALVFSQFTSFLDIVRRRLDERKIPYEYLDGKTRDRQGCVDRFQNDPECKLFLISLKAGGLGLNLTAAEYVFLLDPWWNPAVEAQAIDRAHRIGQTRPVFAYRLIARDTVEEKVLELQRTKRALADAIITADNSLIAKLGRDDLDLLLS